MYCLDTNVVIDILRKNEQIRKKIEEISGVGEIYITTITLCELYRGAYLSNKTDYSFQIINNFLTEVEMINFDKDSCQEFGKIYTSLSKRGKITQELDLMIASIAKVNNLVLITRDKEHFKNTDVKLEIW